MMEKRQVSLQDKYILEEGRAFMTGIQALVRLPMVQRRLDQSRGWDTGGFISGYRGSPLGALDQQLVLNRKLLEEHHVRFNPGVNEDLAATSIWGTQQAELHGQGRYDGVFGLWYGKGPGVDRSGDALRHANLAGTSARGGVLALMGDDHTCESSTTCHQSEFAMMDAMIPVFNPAGVQEILDFGLYGWALSRFSGCWVGLKCIHDTVESTATVDVSSDRCEILLPQDYTMPPEGLNIRWPDTPHEQEARLHENKLVAAKAFVRVNRLNRILMDAPQAKIGIISTGKALLDTRLALDELGIGPEEAKGLGLRLMQIAMPWPLEPEGVKEFSRGLDLIMVVEEKRGLIEPQLKDFLYHTADAPQVIGKQDEKGNRLFPSAGAFDPNHIALSLAERVLAKSSAGTSLERMPWQNSGIVKPDFVTASSPRKRSRNRSRGCLISVQDVPIILLPLFLKEAMLMQGSDAITWPSGWTEVLQVLPTWGQREPTGWENLFSVNVNMCFKTSETEPIFIRVCWPSALQ